MHAIKSPVYDCKNIHIDLKTLMARPTSKMNLFERLNRAYPDKKQKKRTQKKRTHKKRHI